MQINAHLKRLHTFYTPHCCVDMYIKRLHKGGCVEYLGLIISVIFDQNRRFSRKRYDIIP